MVSLGDIKIMAASKPFVKGRNRESEAHWINGGYSFNVSITLLGTNELFVSSLGSLISTYWLEHGWWHQ